MRTDPYLVRAISVSAIIFFLAFALNSINPAGEGGFLLGIIMLGISALLLFIFLLILKMTSRRRQAPGSSPEPDKVQRRTGFFTRRSTILLVCFLTGKFALNVLAMGASGIPSIVIIIVLHIIILVIFGILYARWSGSEEYVPIVAALLVALADSSYYLVSYLSDSGRQFRYGPEIVWFATSGFSVRLMLLAFYAVIVWGSWKLSATKRIAQKHEDRPALITLD